MLMLLQSFSPFKDSSMVDLVTHWLITSPNSWGDLACNGIKVGSNTWWRLMTKGNMKLAMIKVISSFSNKMKTCFDNTLMPYLLWPKLPQKPKTSVLTGTDWRSLTYECKKTSGFTKLIPLQLLVKKVSTPQPIVINQRHFIGMSRLSVGHF